MTAIQSIQISPDLIGWWCGTVYGVICIPLPCTMSCASERVFPAVNLTVPDIAGYVFCRMSLCRFPLASITVSPPLCSIAPFRLHCGGLDRGMDTSHSKQASSGAVTFASLRLLYSWMAKPETEKALETLNTGSFSVLEITDPVVALLCPHDRTSGSLLCQVQCYPWDIL